MQNLVDELLVTLHETDPEIEKAWAEEAERRWQDVQSGKAELIDADVVFDDLRRRLADDKSGRSL